MDSHCMAAWTAWYRSLNPHSHPSFPPTPCELIHQNICPFASVLVAQTCALPILPSKTANLSLGVKRVNRAITFSDLTVYESINAAWIRFMVPCTDQPHMYGCQSSLIAHPHPFSPSLMSLSVRLFPAASLQFVPGGYWSNPSLQPTHYIQSVLPGRGQEGALKQTQPGTAHRVQRLIFHPQLTTGNQYGAALATTRLLLSTRLLFPPSIPPPPPPTQPPLGGGGEGEAGLIYHLKCWWLTLRCNQWGMYLS